MYCTYITFYRGNQLPPFYIGYTSTNKINRGYNGSVASKKYKSAWIQERAERPHLFRTVILRTFATRKDALDHEEHLLRGLQVHKNALYINMHITGKHFTPGPLSEEARKKMSEVAKKRYQDPEYRQKKSEAGKKANAALTPEERSARAKRGAETKAQNPEYRRKLSEASKKRAQAMHSAMTPEQRSARAKKIWETRRLNAARERVV